MLNKCVFLIVSELREIKVIFVTSKVSQKASINLLIHTKKKCVELDGEILEHLLQSFKQNKEH